LTAGNTTPELKVWKFDQTGNITLPQGGIVYETTIPGGALTGNTIALKPQGGTNPDQQLLVYPTALGADANHLHLTTGNLYNTELFLGNDDLYVKLANTGDIVINSNDGVGNSAQWTFSPDSNLTLPGGSQIVDTPTGVLISGAGQTAVNRFYTKISNTLYQTVDVGITYNIIDQAGIWSLDVVGEDNPRYTSVDLITWADAGGGLPAPSGTIISGLANITVNGNTWTFGSNGNLTLPANGYLRVTSGIVGTGASPAPSLSGFGSVSALNLSATGNVTGNNLSTSGNVSTGNLNLPYGATVSITESTTTSGALVFDGTTSYLTVPSSANYAMGTTWTIEFWINADSASTGLLQRIIMQEQDVVALSYIAVSLSDGNLNVLCTQNNSVDYPEPTPGVWTHVAIVNDNSSSQFLDVYYNGVLQTNPTGFGGPANYQSSNAITVGRFPGSNFQYFPGSLADIRITSGIAVYTGAFTVPTSVLTVTQPAGTNIAAIPTTASVVLLLGMLSSATAFDDSSSYNITVTNSGSTFTTSGPGLIGGIGAGVVLKSSAASGTVYNWTFDTAGNLTLPGNTFAVNYANGTPVTFSGSDYGNANVANFLGAFGSNAISTSGNISTGNVFLPQGAVLQDGNTTVLTGNFTANSTNGAVTMYQNGDINISANALLSMGIGATGYIEITTAGIAIEGNITATANTGNFNISGFDSISANTVSTTGNVAGNYFIGNVVATNVSATGNITSGNLISNQDVFATGVLTLAQTLVSNTAVTMRLVADGDNGYIQVGNGVGGSTGNIAFAPYFDGTGTVVINTGSGNVTAGNVVVGKLLVTTPAPLANLTATAGARAFASDANLVAAGNFGAQVSGGAGNTVPVWSDGGNWYIG
jgi:hypothetical protein